MYVRIVLLALLVGALSYSASAQSATIATISGIVSERASGEAIIGGSVALYRDSASVDTGRVIRGYLTNKFGFYSIRGVSPGSYVLQVRSLGFGQQLVPVSIGDPAEDLRRDVQLEPNDVTTREVVVSADRSRSGTAVSTVELKPGFVQQLPALGGEVDIMRTLQLLPGVKSISEISSGLYVRGGSPDENLILLDGVIVYNPSHL